MGALSKHYASMFIAFNVGTSTSLVVANSHHKYVQLGFAWLVSQLICSLKARPYVGRFSNVLLNISQNAKTPSVVYSMCMISGYYFMQSFLMKKEKDIIRSALNTLLLWVSMLDDTHHLKVLLLQLPMALSSLKHTHTYKWLFLPSSPLYAQLLYSRSNILRLLAVSLYYIELDHFFLR